MKKPLLSVTVKKPYAAIFFILLLTATVFITYNNIEVNSFRVHSVIYFIVVGLIGIGFSCYGLFALITNRLEYESNRIEKEPFIIVTEDSVTCKYSSGKEEKILWEKITHVGVMTNDQGPYVCDVFFVLTDYDNAGVIVPQDNEGSQLVLDRILKFPGFDHAAFVEAMSSTENRLYDVWEKK